jgi:drug/metabolite transporter (DMT)-like permease
VVVPFYQEHDSAMSIKPDSVQNNMATLQSPAPQQMLRMGLREWLMLAGLSVIWGGSFFFSKIAVGELPPLSVVLGRVGLAALTLGLVLKLSGTAFPRGREAWVAFAIMGMFNNIVPFGLIFWGQTHIASALAAILNATTPLFTALAAHAFTQDEKLTPGKIIGILIGLVGVAVMVGPQVMGGFQLGWRLDGQTLGQIACLGAALSYGLTGIFGRRFSRMGLAPSQTAFGQLSASSVMLIPIVLLVDRPWQLPLPSMKTTLAIVALAVVSTAFAYIIFFRLMARAGATNVSLVTLLIPPSAILLGVGLLGERLSLDELIGMVLISLGLVAIDGRLWQRLRSML